MSRGLKVLLSAGEASGDRLGAGLARALHRRRPDAEILGMGGDEMAAAGVRLVRHFSEVAVMGLERDPATFLPDLARALVAHVNPDASVEARGSPVDQISSACARHL